MQATPHLAGIVSCMPYKAQFVVLGLACLKTKAHEINAIDLYLTYPQNDILLYMVTL